MDAKPQNQSAPIIANRPASVVMKLARMGSLHQSRLSFMRVLKAKNNRRAAVAFGAAHIVTAAGVTNQIWKFLKPAVPLFDIGHHFTKDFVIGNRHMNSINAAFAHLLENFFRPIGVLQVVNNMHRLNPADLQRYSWFLRWYKIPAHNCPVHGGHRNCCHIRRTAHGNRCRQLAD